MRKRHHLRWLGCLVTAILLTLVLLVGTAAAARAPSTIVARLMGDISTLDPGNVKNINDMFVATNIYASLVRYIPGTSDIEPDLASSWEVSDDGLELVFHLREGLQFHKGYGPVTADDVKFTFDRIIEGGMVQASYLTAVDTVEVIDDLTVQIRLKAFDSAFLSNGCSRELWYEYAVGTPHELPFLTPRSELLLSGHTHSLVGEHLGQGNLCGVE